MAEKILYILGAGASAQALPIARSVGAENEFLKPKIPGLAYSLTEVDLKALFSEVVTPTYPEKVTRMKQQFIELSEKANAFGDVDTYAKFLLLKGMMEEFQSLKKTLSQFFSVKQLIAKVRDQRYLPWMINIMNRSRFPENVKILSWNYDFQVELATEHFGQLEDINLGGTSFSYSPSFIKHYPNLDPTFSEFHELSLLHLNGIAGYFRNDLLDVGSVFQNKAKTSQEKLLDFMEAKNIDNTIRFAWEGDNNHSKLLERVNVMIEGTSILVVIGYSFPFFNREVDKKIFDKLKLSTSFKKIYYQDPVLNGQQLRDQFELSLELHIIHISQTNNFHVPFEY